MGWLGRCWDYLCDQDSDAAVCRDQNKSLRREVEDWRERALAAEAMINPAKEEARHMMDRAMAAEERIGKAVYILQGGPEA